MVTSSSPPFGSKRNEAVVALSGNFEAVAHKRRVSPAAEFFRLLLPVYATKGGEPLFHWNQSSIVPNKHAHVVIGWSQ